MTMKTFVYDRICNFMGQALDPNSDSQVEEALRIRLNIYLPQRPTLDEALFSSNSDHEVIELLLKYRAMP